MEKLNDRQRELFNSCGSLDDYSILKPIGKGKFSIVYRAKHLKNNYLVALKKINIFNLMDIKAREKTLKEVRLVQSVHHPNIIQYIDTFIGNDEELCIVFEWAEAGDLKRQIRKANEKNIRFDEGIIWKYFGQICAAIQHMHLHRIMHRDIKPANIFLMLSGVVKVGDLGLGRYLSENTMEAHSKVGTPLYMSPEVLRGDGYDWKCDVWSLGCILYELAMLRSPFKSEGLNLYGLFQKVNKGEYEPISNIYSDTLRNLVAQMLSLDANERPTLQVLCNTATSSIDNPPPNHEQNQIQVPVDQKDDERNSIASRESNQSQEPSRPSSSQETTNSNGHHIIYLMDLVYEKLVLLGYEKSIQQTISRTYFAFPLHHRAAQFRHFCCVIEWLLTQLNISIEYNLQDDTISPAQRSTAILVAMDKANIDVHGITPAALLSGSGVACCELLHKLTDKTLERNKPHRAIMQPREPEETSQDDSGQHEWTEDNNIDEEDDNPCENSIRNFDEVVENAHALPISYVQIDIKAWQAEIERNTPKIRQERQRLTTPQHHWQDRFAALNEHGKTFSTWRREATERLHESLKSHVESILLKEKLLNEQCQSYREQYQRRRDHEIHLNHHREALDNLRRDMQETHDSVMVRLEQTQRTLKDQGEKLTDTTPLTEIHNGLKRIKSEVAAMEMAIALTRTRLFHAKIKR